MKKIIISLITFIFVFSFFLTVSESGFVKSETIWNKASNGIREENIKCILIDLKDSDRIFVGTERSVYLSKDAGKYYKKVLNVSGRNSKVNLLTQDNDRPEIIYAATSDGLYRTNNKGKSWRNIFKGMNSLQRYCNEVSIVHKVIYLATKEGLFFSLDNAKTWKRISGTLGNAEIISIAKGEDNIYLATEEGIYSLSFDLKTQNKLYSIFTKETNDNNDFDDNDSEETKGFSRIASIKVDSKNSQNIYFSSDQGLFLSVDAGKSWQRFNLQGLLSKNISSITFHPKDNHVIVGTDKGIFQFYRNKWQQLYKGMITNRINYLATDSASNLWAATEKGVFKGSTLELEKHIYEPERIKEVLNAFKDEPTIQEIQKKAIQYAEVQPEKISNWRKQAMLAAFMPSLSLDYDKNVYGSGSTKTSTTPLQYGTAMVGPRDWGMSLSWDLSELVWNPDQTSIDSRSKLMVELREDILDEVTRLYFERRRLQTEFLISPPEEANERLDKVMRLEELTASIDALTGGYLSKALIDIDSASTSSGSSSF